MRPRWRRWGLRLVLATGIACLALRRSLVEVAGPSMEPTLRAGERLLTLPAGRRLLRAGMLVVLEDPETTGHLVVKRLVRVAGDAVIVVGDNPWQSTDSRRWGPVHHTALRRIVVCRWPQVRRSFLGAATDVPPADHVWQALRAAHRRQA